MRDFKNEEALNTLNHSCAHVLAQAVKHLYPQAKFWVGPVVSCLLYTSYRELMDAPDEEVVEDKKEPARQVSSEELQDLLNQLKEGQL